MAESVEITNVLTDLIVKAKPNQEVILAGDLGGRTGQIWNNNTVGAYGEQTVGDNGERFIELCQLNDFRITNGFFKYKEIRKYTWTQEKHNLKFIIEYTYL